MNNKFLYNAACIVMLTTFLAGCGGRAPNPISISRPGDMMMSCFSLESEMCEVEGYIKKLIPDTQKTGKNVGLGVAGCFLLVPWFFMDFSDAEKIEVDAYRQRYNHLVRIYNAKRCDIKMMRREIPAFDDPRRNRFDDKPDHRSRRHHLDDDDF